MIEHADLNEANILILIAQNKAEWPTLSKGPSKNTESGTKFSCYTDAIGTQCLHQFDKFSHLCVVTAIVASITASRMIITARRDSNDMQLQHSPLHIVTKYNFIIT